MNLEAHLALPRDAQFVGVAREVVGTLLRGMATPIDVVDDLKLAVTEVCANVVKHAADSQHYRVEVEVEAERCVVEIADTGPGFDYARDDRDVSLATDESGRGLSLMQALTDEVHFVRSADEMLVRLLKTW